MNDKDRALVEQVLSAAGTVGQKGFGYMVHYQIVDGLVGIAGNAVIFLGLFLIGKRLMQWHPRKDNGDPDMVYVIRGGIVAIVAIVALVCVLSFFSSVTQLLAPEGAAIKSALHG